MKESRKTFEERLVTEMLEEIKVEPLCNILSYAASYLQGKKPFIIQPIDIERAKILEKYADKMAERIREVRI